MDDNDGSDSALFELDDRLIDYDMLTADPEDADRIYQELKERAMRQRRKDLKDKEIEDAIEIDESEESGSEETQAESDIHSASKLQQVLEKSSKQEIEDFTNGLLNFINKADKRKIDSLLPALKFLVSQVFILANIFYLGRTKFT